MERNLDRIFGIITDYLDYHFDMLENAVNPEPIPEPVVTISNEEPEPDPTDEKPKKKGFIRRFIDKIKGLFKRKKKHHSLMNVQDGENEVIPNKDKDEEPLDSPIPKRKPYNESYYLLYGFENELASLDLLGTYDYLVDMGYANNPLAQARNGIEVSKYVNQQFKPGKPNVRYCDFCGAEIFGVEYETLQDGRDRCINCSRTAIKTESEFVKLFEETKLNMELLFNIRINADIEVEMVNAKKLHDKLGYAYIPSPQKDGRVLGVAIKNRKGYSLLLENGAPRMASIMTIVHELTHIWQYLNWDDKKIVAKYGKDLRLQIYEGMAKWAEIQYAYLVNEATVAKREDIITSSRKDEYGYGYLRYKANYQFSFGTMIINETPFENIDTPLDLSYCSGYVNVVDPLIDTPQGYDISDKHRGSRKIKRKRLPDPRKGVIERHVNQLQPYAYQQLNDDQKKVYDIMLTTIQQHGASIENLEVSLKYEDIQHVSAAIIVDHPEIFWYEGGYRYIETDDSIVQKIMFIYCLNEEETKQRQAQIEAALPAFLNNVNDDMSDYALTLQIYENIINLTDYDSIGLEKQKREGNEYENPDDLRSIYGVFVQKKAVCAGYARATQYLLNLKGIECVYVGNGSHAWNLVKLEQDYYYLDTTWGDGTNTQVDKNDINEINYDAFCITTQEVLKLDSHELNTRFTFPECTATKCNYYRREGLFFETFDYERIQELVCMTLERHKKEVSFKFANDAIFDEALKALVSEGKFRASLQNASMQTKVRVSTKYIYSEKKHKLIISFYPEYL